MIYKRTDIQILRALAVIFVVLFHLEIAGIESGFLGVDVFFVLSGFLMAILYKQGQIKQFFERRAKRLLPAYFATIILTLFASLFLVMPSELGQVTTQAIYGLFFSNNIGFWMQNSYFSKAEFNPLLHLWSLGVEIQFYLIVPLLAWFFRKSKIFLFLALLGSFSACVFIVGISPKTSFFMMPLRMWEFLLGFVVAYYLTINGAVKYNKFSWLGVIGLLVVCVIPFISVNGQSLNRLEAHPSFYALLVCAATCLVLGFGLPKVFEQNPISLFLSKIGDYSYSIYLVHFPIIVLYLYEPFSGTKLYPESYVDKLILLSLIVVFSVLMHKLVETQKFKSFKKAYIGLVVLLLGLTGATQAVPKMYSQENQNIFNSVKDRGVYRCGKIFRIKNPSAYSCKINPQNFDKSVLLLGNSHADSIKEVFSSVAGTYKYNTYFTVTNVAMFDDFIVVDDIINEVLDKKISWIFIHYRPGSLDLVKTEELIEFGMKNNIKVTLIMPVPFYENDPYYEESIPKILLNDKQPKQSYKDYLEFNNEVFNKANVFEKYYTNFSYLNTGDIFCTPICSISTADKRPYYYDDDHLTLTGSQLLKPLFVKAFKSQ